MPLEPDLTTTNLQYIRSLLKMKTNAEMLCMATQIANDQVPSILVLHTCTDQIIQALDSFAQRLNDGI